MPKSKDLKRLRFLLIDDDPGMRRSIQRSLRELGDAVATDDGALGLTMLTRAAIAGTPYDLLLLDEWVPGMSSLDLVATLRAEPRFDLPIIFMPPDPILGPLRDDFAQLRKPFTGDELRLCVLRLLGRDSR